MFIKDLSLTVLFDIYGELLSESEKEAFELYYCDDLSLSEISENTGKTRQGARDSIVRAEKSLKGFEEKLGLYAKQVENEKTLAMIKKALSEENYAYAGELLSNIKI